MTNWTKFRPMYLAAALLLVSATAQAQQSQQPDPAATAETYTQPAAPAANFSDIELKAFAKARERVDAIRMEMLNKLQSTEGQQEKQKLQEEASTKMVAAVEASGLSPAKYNEIARTAMSDPTLAEKLTQLQ